MVLEHDAVADLLPGVIDLEEEVQYGSTDDNVVLLTVAAACGWDDLI